MKVEAYKCEVCNKIQEEKYIVGIIPTEDIFEPQKSFPTTPKLNATDCHYCLSCFNKKVLLPASAFALDNLEHHAKINELAYVLRRTAFFKYLERKKIK